EEDVDTIETGSRLGMFLVLTARPKEGLEYLEKAKEVCLKIKGPKDPFYTPQVLLQYGRALEAIGRPEQALQSISEAVENRRKNRPGTGYLAQMLEDQALVLTELGQYEEADKLLRESEHIHNQVGQKLDINYFAPCVKLALAKGDLDGANALLDHNFGAPSESAELSGPSLSNLEARSEIAVRRGDGKSAIALAHRISAAIESSRQQVYFGGFYSRALLNEAEGRLLQRDGAGTMPLIQRAAQRQVEMSDPTSPTLARTAALLGWAYLESGDRKRAAESLAKAKAILRAHPQLSDRYALTVRELSERMALANHRLQ
ncbi:MAG TPA: tetratricopeptide repeat protein, partial [Bryobacteraceae bacterium]|nr:tetratricopeptide repeat protein [Bryobacteraceae bacterium]